jgi:hypothetical protein
MNLGPMNRDFKTVVAKETNHQRAKELTRLATGAHIHARVRFANGGWLVTVSNAEDAARMAPIVVAARANRRQ